MSLSQRISLQIHNRVWRQTGDGTEIIEGWSSRKRQRPVREISKKYENNRISGNKQSPFAFAASGNQKQHESEIAPEQFTERGTSQLLRVELLHQESEPINGTRQKVAMCPLERRNHRTLAHGLDELEKGMVRGELMVRWVEACHQNSPPFSDFDY